MKTSAKMSNQSIHAERILILKIFLTDGYRDLTLRLSENYDKSLVGLFNCLRKLQVHITANNRTRYIWQLYGHEYSICQDKVEACLSGYVWLDIVFFVICNPLLNEKPEEG